MSWLIYKHKNTKNGKVYIGQTKQLPSLRWKNGLGYTRDNRFSVFAKAIKKYGWSSFESEIIENNVASQEEANIREQYWISYYRSYIGFPDSNGYNMTLGGDSGEHLGYCVYQIDKATLRVINKFPSIAEASRQFNNGEGNASQIRRCCEGRKPSCKGYYWCYANNYSESWKPKDNALLTPVLQINDDLEVIRKFDSIAEAVKQGFSGGTIVQCCKGKCAKANGYHWCYLSDYSSNWMPPELSFKRNEKIYCFETDTIYSSSKEAAERTGANPGKILRCCRGLENGTNGMHFCFAKDRYHYRLKPTTKRANPFSEEELNILKQQYPLMGTDVIKYLPNRTAKAISQQAHRMGLRYIGKSKQYKKVFCVETGVIFDSIEEAYRFAGLKDGSSIGACCKRKKKTAGGYHWKYVN